MTSTDAREVVQGPRGAEGPPGRLDARAKASGSFRYVADLLPPGTAYGAVVRSASPHATIVRIDISEALAQPGVIGVYTAADVTEATYGRGLRDAPVLARGKVRFVGEPVAAVVAETRQIAEAAAALVDVEYDELPAVTTIEAALAPDAPRVHDTPWEYPGAAVNEGDPGNWIFHHDHGDREAVEEALRTSQHVVDETYRLQSVHQGYLETQACIAQWGDDGRLQLWLTNKSPYALRTQLSACLGIDQSEIDIRPAPIGGDFGGKGSPEHAPLCAELARLSGRPVKMVLRYNEDLTATNPRHPAIIRVRVGCDEGGRLTAMDLNATFNAGAYGGFTPRAPGPHGVAEIDAYRVPLMATEITRVYTNAVPRGNMRAPGAPQGNFAIESAVDELARAAGIEPAEFRRRNFVRQEDIGTEGYHWVEYRGNETLNAALDAYRELPVPDGWLNGRGISVFCHSTPVVASTSLRLVPLPDGRVRVELPITETGTGSHTVARELVCDGIGLRSDEVEVAQVGTDDLPQDAGAGGSRVTASLAYMMDDAMKAWRNRLRDDEPVTVKFSQDSGPQVGSYCIHIAQVAIDPETGQMKVLQILTAVDVAAIINQKAHQMQIDGAVTMGFGYACLEDLDEDEGQVWAATLGEFKLPSVQDVPVLRTVLVHGGIGVGAANVKNIGETCNPGVGAVIANAVADATGKRLRQLPITAQRIYGALHG